MHYNLNLNRRLHSKLLLALIVVFSAALVLVEIDFSEVPKFYYKNTYLPAHNECISRKVLFPRQDVIIHRLNARGKNGNMTGWHDLTVVNFAPLMSVEHLMTLGFGWENNLSWTYLNFFLHLINNYDSGYFIILEDDVGLDDEEKFLIELNCVVKVSPLFFSFFNEYRPSTDVYDYGTQLFYISKDFVQEWLDIKLSGLKAKPFDIELSSMHPLRKTTDNYITHIGKHFTAKSLLLGQ
jgi:hypothetical protein